LKHFDKDASKTINFNEFLIAIRGELNDYRISWIKKAYEKLDVNKDGLVKLDDIAKIYDVSKHPEITNGSADPKNVFMQFMSLWDTQVADGIITFDEFCDYYKDVSASIDSDEYFGVMMAAAWKI
jgi:Ca2+-binding EF-hand superfamily protein